MVIYKISSLVVCVNLLTKKGMFLLTMVLRGCKMALQNN